MLACVVLALAELGGTTVSAAEAPAVPARAWFRDGQAQVVPAFEDASRWIRESLWVETEFDSDGDGKRDRVFAEVTRPGQNEAGGFQIYGLGHHWARKLNDAVGKSGSRWHDNVVMLPDDPVNPSGRGRMTFHDADPKTGSGTVTFDMSRAYQCFREVGEGTDKKRELYDAGITGTRAFAADYSGQCGAPALFAIADRITGGGRKVWAMQLPPVDRDGPDHKLTIEGNSFVLAYKDATMKATFVSPPNVQITHAKGRMKAHPLSKIDDAEVKAIHASGVNPAAGDFLVVLTLQKDAAPAVTVQNGAAKVGGRTVTFDGGN